MSNPTPDAILAGCDESQRAAITSPLAPLLVVAGAGAGKTRVLTRRIAWQIVVDRIRPDRALALTFTRKAARELRWRLSGLGLSSTVPAGTFHSIALAELRRRAIDTGRAVPVITDAKHTIVERVVRKMHLGDPHSASIGRIVAEIEWAKARRVSPDRYVAHASDARRRPTVPLDEVGSIYAAYEIEKRRRGVLDLDDLLERLTEELDADPNFAAATRWRIAHLFVDELQDVNPAQLALLDAWLGDRSEIFAVGDARQAIYEWNGAEPDAMGAFARAHPGTSILTLAANYRSTSAIVDVASAVLGDRSMRAMRTDPGPNPTITEYSDELEEATAVAEGVADARRGGREWSTCAVLARTNAQLDAVRRACESASVGVRSSASGYLSSPAVAAALGPIARTSDASTFSRWLENLRVRVSTAGGQHSSEVDGAQVTLLDLAADFAEGDPLPTGAGFMRYLRDAADTAGSSSEVGVDLLTFHRAKGLEWRSVWVVGLEDGYVPLPHASTDAQRDEERRLLYVALTRATDALHCSWARRRTMNGRLIERTPSPFLKPVDDAIAALGASPYDPSRTARLGIAASRRALGQRSDRRGRETPR
jgi:DNA helicase-2/ATP-dependent DNA helicase PcrA